MQLQITDKQQIAELQDKFNECFPDLKIEFYLQSPEKGKELATEQVVPPTFQIGQIRKKPRSGTLEIKSWFKTIKVKEDFSQFGLMVQILRRQGAGWAPTTGTEELTLKEQSDLAKRSQGKRSSDEVSANEDEEVLPGF